jgi:NTP pyrophosphatase (non-canonical NTP hydrolase)
MTPFEKVCEFQRGARQVVGAPLQDDQTLDLRLNLIDEENDEFLCALYAYLNRPTTMNLKALRKELADFLYVLYGFAATYGLPVDDDFNKTHDSNMSKLDGAQWREDGKLLKGPNYKPPVLTDPV